MIRYTIVRIWSWQVFVSTAVSDHSASHYQAEEPKGNYHVINACPNEYEFQESSWDAMALIGVPCVGYGDACLGVFANFTAALLQFLFCMVVQICWVHLTACTPLPSFLMTPGVSQQIRSRNVDWVFPACFRLHVNVGRIVQMSAQIIGRFFAISFSTCFEISFSLSPTGYSFSFE